MTAARGTSPMNEPTTPERIEALERVYAAAKNLFGMRTIETDTGEFWRHNAACDWMQRPLYDAISDLERTETSLRR